MTRTTLFAAAFTAFFVGLRPVPGVEFHVAVSGDDAATGSQEQPLATIARARDLARQQKEQPVKILLHGGKYYLDETVVFTPEDSRTTVAPLLLGAAADEQVVISGGQRLAPKWQAYRDGIFQTKLPIGSQFDQLFVDGQRQQMARYPNYDPKSQYFQGYSADSTAAERVKTWGNPIGGVVHAMHRSLWGDMHWQITGKTVDGQLELVGGWQNNRQMGAHKEYRFVENIFEELDAPGEWYLDEKQSLLYFYPPAGLDLADAEYEAVRLPHLFEFRGNATSPVRNIAIEGLTLTHTARTFMENKEPLLRSDWTTYRGGAILFDGAEDCVVRDCFLDQVGGNAIFVNNYNRRIKVVRCHLANAGANAISFVGNPKSLRSPLFEYHQAAELTEIDKAPGPKTNDYPADCTVEDCLIYRNGRVEKQTAGVNICTAESITIRHASIYDCPRAGINVCNGAFGGHVIEFCDVFDTVKETGDHGSFNSWGRDRFWHPDRKITAQWLERYPDMPKWDCRKTIVLRNNRWRCDHGWDIDLDDGSSNYEIYNNLCLAGGIKLREGYYRNVFNNILVNYTFCPHVWYPDCHTSFRHNIIWQDKYAPAGMRATDQVHTVDENLVHQPGGALRPAEELIKFGGDQHSMIGDAMFRDTSKGDYRVQDKSPAIKLGFQNFAMQQFGVRDPQLSTIARKPPLPGTLEAARISSGGWGRKYSLKRTADWLGAKLKEIEDDGEMSAVGLGDKDGVLVVEVPEGTLAYEHGLRENDVILRVDGVAVPNLKDLARQLKDREQAKAVRLIVWRDQAECQLDVALR
jgi:hypothetical protein